MRARSLAVLATIALAVPAHAQSTVWSVSQSDGFVTAQTGGFMDGLIVACGGGGLQVTYYPPDLPADFGDADSGDLVLRTDAGVEIERPVTRRDAWSFTETGAAAAEVAATLYAAGTVAVSLGDRQIGQIDIESGRKELYAALNACRLDVAEPGQEEESTEIPADRWIFAERTDDSPIAATRAGQAMVLITCGYGHFQLHYSFPEAEIDRDVAKNDSADLVLGIDGSPNSFFDSVQGVRSSDRVTFSVPAEPWLGPLSVASRTIYLSLEETGANRLGNTADFTASGSTAAIASLRAACKDR